MKKIKTLILLLICTNILYAQKSKMLTIGAVADFPLSRKLYFDNGIGAEASLIFAKENVSKLIFTFSYLQYQYSDYRFPSGATEPYYLKSTEPLYRITGGNFIKINEKFLFNMQGGFVFDRSGRQATSSVQIILMAGPTLILPIKEKYCAKFNANIGYFGGGLLLSIGGALGLKFH